ncbi:hypothetical protein K437DRAFT_294517 [Tilletiaria anomala UBC 951]|uniref:Altered inheritance of mitochondria protein 6 n=1 Tax=Tilletiaria anomala (strain ATCC 24038 / CBS 436.72 / UBC 951) TaxID=1037660 RepID=A0A066VVS0_TILAU|nr:uncharacterized protein K437DRAFT_294517 [Tilletiaria anomala UBC 951]KDN45596.1 hypothetical protein K437DRAFT_294517 [Tilletiaria anomala UBC 951]
MLDLNPGPGRGRHADGYASVSSRPYAYPRRHDEQDEWGVVDSTARRQRTMMNSASWLLRLPLVGSLLTSTPPPPPYSPSAPRRARQRMRQPSRPSLSAFEEEEDAADQNTDTDSGSYASSYDGSHAYYYYDDNDEDNGGARTCKRCGGGGSSSSSADARATAVLPSAIGHHPRHSSSNANGETMGAAHEKASSGAAAARGGGFHMHHPSHARAHADNQAPSPAAAVVEIPLTPMPRDGWAHTRPRYSSRGRGRGRRNSRSNLSSRNESFLDLLFILVPTLAACALSFVLGISFEVLRSSIIGAKGSSGSTRSRFSASRWSGAYSLDGAGAAAIAAGPGCSAMDLAMAHIQPVETLRIHSHNDETRAKPLLEALSYGAISVEADVWRVDNSSLLYVGHELESLSEVYTLRSTYIDPLVTILEQRNARGVEPSSRSSAGRRGHRSGDDAPALEQQSDRHNRTWNGVYKSAPEQTLYLFLDIKSDSLSTWASMHDALQPLRQRGWLTRWSNGHDLIPGAVTVIGTGDAPVSLVAPQRDRDVFIDAPVHDLAQPIRGDDGQTYAYNATLSPIASGNWLTSISYMGLLPASDATRASIRRMSRDAHRRGMYVRWWANPAWPPFARNRAWKVMLDEEVDLINTDVLESAADVLLESGKSKRLQPLDTKVKH